MERDKIGDVGDEGWCELGMAWGYGARRGRAGAESCGDKGWGDGPSTSIEG